MAAALTIEELIAEEETVQLGGFDYELAWRLAVPFARRPL